VDSDKETSESTSQRKKKEIKIYASWAAVVQG